MTIEDLLARATRLAVAPAPAGSAEPAGRAVLGITGPPGAGKSTLAEHLATALARRGVRVARVPMDGFHLADVELDRLGRRDRKGAVDTFDPYGYLALLRRARTDRSAVVYAPDFDRAIEQPVAGSIPIEPGIDLVLTEGNYLLADVEPWPRIRRELEEVWYCALPDDVRADRLVARHERFGKSPQDAARWVRTVDEPNAAAIAARSGAADVVVDMVRLALPAGRDGESHPRTLPGPTAH